ncbi:MAG: polyprenyl synthetase family protein [Candidatus Omnitrophota bacterium]
MKNDKRLKRDKQIIEKALKKYLGRLKGPAALIRAMRYAVLSGGKRLRPILTMESSRALGGDIRRAVAFACAIELVHNFSLVHDDLPAMDNDDTRRGKPTCHKKFGEGLAILAGDGLLNLAFGIIAKEKTRQTLSAVSLLSEAIGAGGMIGGQALEAAYDDSSARGCQKGKIDTMKTAAIMAASCKIGALLAGGKKKDTKRVCEYGKNLGRAFQIADDIADRPLGKAALCKMRRKVKFFISKSKREIAPFGKKAEVLDYIADRINAKTN